MTNNKEKRELKTEPRLKVQLTPEQKNVIKDFYEYDVNFILGDFGSGKSLTAVYAAIAAYRKKQFNNIWITRPMLKNKLAALPGTMEEKMFPYIYPIIQNLEVCQGKATTDRMREKGEIKIMPIDVAKGVTFMDSVVIVDEFQDMDYADFRTIITRLGKNSKMIFCGSVEQVDKAIGKSSCIYKVLKLEEADFVGFNILTANHRNDVLTKIIRFLEEDEKRKTS
jgi:phosphate starvation-inducible protein PhoH